MVLRCLHHNWGSPYKLISNFRNYYTLKGACKPAVLRSMDWPEGSLEPMKISLYITDVILTFKAPSRIVADYLCVCVCVCVGWGGGGGGKNFFRETMA